MHAIVVVTAQMVSMAMVLATAVMVTLLVLLVRNVQIPHTMAQTALLCVNVFMVSAMLVSMVMGHVPVKQDIKADTVMKLLQVVRQWNVIRMPIVPT